MEKQGARKEKPMPVNIDNFKLCSVSVSVYVEGFMMCGGQG